MEDFRNVPPSAERKANPTPHVRQVSRHFAAAGVVRTERSIVNWCPRNALGTAKLDAYFDPHERKYFITPGSVEVAIAAEQAKAQKPGQRFYHPLAGTSAAYVEIAVVRIPAVPMPSLLQFLVQVIQQDIQEQRR